MSTSSHPCTPQLKRSTERELQRLIESPNFRGSQRAQRVLRHLVDRTLEGNLDRLKERIIGIELFGRDAGYDTGQDAIVRVAVNDVRRRLAEYYEHQGASHPDSCVHIYLPVGSYVPEFRLPDPPGDSKPAAAAQGGAEPVKNAAQASRFKLWPVLLALAGVAVAAVAVFVYASGRDPRDQFWAPFVVNRNRAVMMCVTQPMLYRMLLDGERPQAQAQAGRIAAGRSTAELCGDLFFPMRDSYVSNETAHVVADIASVLSSYRTRWEIRGGDQFSSEDFRKGPIVLVGRDSSPWTSKLTQGFRFVFDGDARIRDSGQPGRAWPRPAIPLNWRVTEDHAIISRFVATETGQPVLILAGFTALGTRSAGELIIRPDLLAAALRQAPADWKGNNLQFVIHTKVTERTPGPPTLVASHFW